MRRQITEEINMADGISSLHGNERMPPQSRDRSSKSKTPELINKVTER